MEQIETAILTGQKTVVVNGVLFEGLPKVPRDTQVNKEKFAQKKAKELFQLIQ